MGVHAIDGFIDLCGEVDQVYCQSFRRVVEVDADDTTSILFRMKEGMSAYLATMTATGGGFNFQVYGSKGYIKLEGMTHVAGAPSEERRMELFSNCMFKPIKGPAETWKAAKFDVTKAALIHLTKQLAPELGPKVRVNAICPGLIKTDFARMLWEGERGDEVATAYPLGRLGEVEDIAAAALWLAADSGSWVTGQAIVLDGGGLVQFRGE